MHSRQVFVRNAWPSDARDAGSPTRSAVSRTLVGAAARSPTPGRGILPSAERTNRGPRRRSIRWNLALATPSLLK
ncbi:unnamed protein product [Leptosia nina]|uniref:Uncharacterized protein n=1 Tax=Leptosia nina TaxID=320188 RepID=A0AAV1JGD8_9NEOP